MKRFDANAHTGRSSAGLMEQRRANELRREREIGNWGRASEHIGQAWESVGFQRLQSMVAAKKHWPTVGHRVHALAPLMFDSALQTSLMRIGLPSPDVVVVLADESGRLFLQALDFKWNLEFATYAQIRASALRALLGRGAPALAAMLRDAVGGPIDGLDFLDGLLFAPDHLDNHRFLASGANARREYPIEASEVVFAPVGAEEFFSQLPGWQMAMHLAALDRAVAVLKKVEGAERYYRLGTGVLGAACQLRASIFERDPAALDATQAMEWLCGGIGRPSSTMLVDQAERMMAVRMRQAERLKRLTKSPYRWSDLQRALMVRKIVLTEQNGDGTGSTEKRRWQDLMRRIGGEYRATIMRAGLRFVRDGMSDDEALARLEMDLARFEAAARTVAAQMIEVEFGKAL